jgi:hypothetical protein
MGRRSILFFGLVCVWVTIGACAAPVSENKEGGLAVLFDGAPLLSDEKIYYYGAPVGQITATIRAENQVTQLTVRLQPEFAAQVGDNLAFFAHAGRLEAVTLAKMFRPLQKGATLSGFTSRADLRWFKLKTLLRDRAAAAARRAGQLNRRLG